MKLLFKKIIFLVVAVSLINGIFLSSAKANSSQSINIQAQITGGGCVGPCCNGGCSDSVPTISGVTSSVSYTSAVINWSASDVEGPVNVVFVYGLTNSYGQTGLVTGNYSTNLSGLATSTLYYFKISATDSASQTTNFTGSFQTNSVIILPDTTGPVMSNIVVTSSLSNALVTFNTDENATSRINFGLTSGLGSTALEGIAANMFHSVTLPGLSSGKKYYFQIHFGLCFL